jgi:hypothetical protein
MSKVSGRKQTRRYALDAQWHRQTVTEKQAQNKEAHRTTDEEAIETQSQKGVQGEWEHNNQHLGSLVALVHCGVDAEVKTGDEHDSNK